MMTMTIMTVCGSSSVDISTDNSSLIPSVICCSGVTLSIFKPSVSYLPCFSSLRCPHQEYWPRLCNAGMPVCVWLDLHLRASDKGRGVQLECRKVWWEGRALETSAALSDWNGNPAAPCDPALTCSQDARLVHLVAISYPSVEMPLTSYQEYLAEVWTCM